MKDFLSFFFHFPFPFALQVCSTSGGRKAVRLAACLRQSNRLSFLGRARHAIKELEKAIADIGEDVKLLEEVSLQVRGKNAVG